ncbi:MAG TPA: hypothetical protein VFG81_03720 [Anaerolineales bacterium]|nr:hypothetical protein [Anaerolineales bacterium]
MTKQTPVSRRLLHPTGSQRHVYAILCVFVRVIARAALSQRFDSEGKKRVMAHPKGFR